MIIDNIRSCSVISSGETVMLPVLGMRGGFSLDLDHEDNSLLLVGWSRTEGEEEVRHAISNTGHVTKLSHQAV